ncbi:urease accessory protein UreF [Labrys monachus]|uniref:Urease accessory protein UreF n=1 Tax=Labrys monachus TaxID=217067 RepID=A0ABU0FNS5_9HYPH|nr:urease accessory UreF family protein [Labrys monachus]MDQ0396259.1 urease accessory protein [Labrys monachus]
MMDEAAAASRLVLWFSPGFPTGAFGFSHGLEWAVEIGDVARAADLTSWIETLIEQGGGWSDAVLVSLSYRAALSGDEAAMADLAELALALQPSRERRLETGVQGDAFLKAVETGWPNEAAARLRQAWPGACALPIAVGTAGAGAALPLEALLSAFLSGFAANLVSAAIRLAPIGQSDGLRVLASLGPLIARCAARAVDAGPEDLGTLAIRSDIASMRHETQFTRLFRS